MSIKKMAKATQRNVDRGLEEAATMQRAGRWDEALGVYRDILRKAPNHLDALRFAGALAVRLGKIEEACDFFGRLASKSPPDPAAFCNHAVALGNLNRVDEALVQVDRALALKPDYAFAHYNRGVLLQKLGRHAEAIANYDRALLAHPSEPQLHINRGASLHMIGRNEEALASLNRALALNPKSSDAHFNRGHSLRDLGRHEDALLSYDAAAAADPANAGAQFDRAVTRLRLGDFANGFAQFEARWEIDPLYNPKRNFAQPRWQGEDISGRTILLHAEQGLGDTIQLLRYVPQVAQLGCRVVLEADAALLPLIEIVKDKLGISTLIAKGSALPSFDVFCPLMSLPRVLQTRADTIPAPRSYLEADPARAATWCAKLGIEGKSIGLVWAGAPHHANDRNRSMGLSSLERLIASHPAITFVSMQKDRRDEDAVVLARHVNVRHFASELFADFADTAALIDCLDGVIAVDTSVAHLAGALGTPTLLLVPFVPDWRWLLERRDSPWYPRFTLLRQPALGDWNSVVDAALGEIAAGWPA